MTTGDRPTVLHGGARRLPVRWLNVSDPPPVTISRYRVEPGEAVTRHVHTGKVEYWLILEGEGIARVGEQDFPVSVGDIVVTVPSVPHELRNIGASPLLFVNVALPSGDAPITTTELV